MKKQRGLKRYYRALRKRLASVVIDVSPTRWYCLWHMHIGFYSKSNVPEKHQREHIKLLFGLYELIEKQLKAYPHPYQIWIDYDEEYPFEHAVYVHTESPVEGSKFPALNEVVIWDVDVPKLVAPYFDRDNMAIGRLTDTETKTMYVILKKRHLPE